MNINKLEYISIACLILLSSIHSSFLVPWLWRVLQLGVGVSNPYATLNKQITILAIVGTFFSHFCNLGAKEEA